MGGLTWLPQFLGDLLAKVDVIGRQAFEQKPLDRPIRIGEDLIVPCDRAFEGTPGLSRLGADETPIAEGGRIRGASRGWTQRRDSPPDFPGGDLVEPPRRIRPAAEDVELDVHHMRIS